jgi:hypothetical protein
VPGTGGASREWFAPTGTWQPVTGVRPSPAFIRRRPAPDEDPGGDAAGEGDAGAPEPHDHGTAQGQASLDLEEVPAVKALGGEARSVGRRHGLDARGDAGVELGEGDGRGRIHRPDSTPQAIDA